MKLVLYIKEMRPKNWLKNIFIFIPLVFSSELFDYEKFVLTSIAFVAFCLVSSAVYVFNDICDAEKDALHPTKRTRPIASGELTKFKAAFFCSFLLLFGLIVAFFVKLDVFVLVVVYILVNLLYCLWLKHKPIIDCFCIATGFVLRVFIGGALITDGMSNWLFLTVVAMSLFMAFGKRRGEMLKTTDGETRIVLESYNLQFLNAMHFVCAGLTIVFYSLWTMYQETNMIYTVPLVIFIVCKYSLLVYSEKHSNGHGDPTTVIFSDITLIAACLIYAVATVALLYLN
ncbi:MAG: decaprenyl-phosphate phosphoribosyltransferase [Oscillospiraceae bacterium]|jgi:4-hydroxybenzoate polyprenyltransferase|nr:decaprenyl-phosphate phosphoribosyltransferase [Oscillospiraceae bacterium]